MTVLKLEGQKPRCTFSGGWYVGTDLSLSRESYRARLSWAQARVRQSPLEQCHGRRPYLPWYNCSHDKRTRNAGCRESSLDWRVSPKLSFLRGLSKPVFPRGSRRSEYSSLLTAMLQMLGTVVCCYRALLAVVHNSRGSIVPCGIDYFPFIHAMIVWPPHCKKWPLGTRRDF